MFVECWTVDKLVQDHGRHTVGGEQIGAWSDGAYETESEILPHCASSLPKSLQVLSS